MKNITESLSMSRRGFMQRSALATAAVGLGAGSLSLPALAAGGYEAG